MGSIAYEETTTRPPDVKVFFSPGDYNHALESYFAARDWVVETGQCFRPDIYGVINRPHHPQNPAREQFVPPELINAEGWSVTVDLWVADKVALEWLRRQRAPEGSQLVVVAEDANL